MCFLLSCSCLPPSPSHKLHSGSATNFITKGRNLKDAFILVVLVYELSKVSIEVPNSKISSFPRFLMIDKRKLLCHEIIMKYGSSSKKSPYLILDTVGRKYILWKGMNDEFRKTHQIPGVLSNFSKEFPKISLISWNFTRKFDKFFYKFSNNLLKLFFKSVLSASVTSWKFFHGYCFDFL